MPQDNPLNAGVDRNIYELLIDSVKNYALFTLDTDGHVRSWNAGAKIILGYTAEQIIGAHFEIFYTPTDRASGLPRRFLQAALDNGRTQHIGWRVRRDGAAFWTEVTISALYDENKKLLGFSKVTRDLTEQKEAEANIRKYALLEARNKEMEQFTFLASHDLLEPLQTVSSFVALLSEEYQDKLGPDGARYIDFISTSTSRMMEQVKGLLYYSRLGADKKLEQVDSSELVRTILDDLGAEIAESQAVIEAGPLPILTAYPSELRQLIFHLTSNAIKFHHTGVPPLIRISASQVDGTWTFAIADNGIGISERYTEKIFAIFHRLHDRHEYGGIGIGLAYCKKIVDLHGGDIWVESMPGSGSTFYFTIKT